MEELKTKIKNYFIDLNFDDKNHSYNIKNNIKIKLSVTNLIKNFIEPFDSENISSIVAKKRNITQEEVLKEWKNIKDEACDKGNKIHLFGESYPFNKNLKPQNKFENAIVKFCNNIPSNINFFMTELKMYHKKYMFAGTTDIIFYNKDTDKFIIGDWKTNKDLFKNYKGKKMKKPFDNLLDCPYNHYQLQLSFYQILFEQLGLKVSSRKLIWLKPTGNYELYNTKNYTNVLNNYLKYNAL